MRKDTAALIGSELNGNARAEEVAEWGLEPEVGIKSGCNGGEFCFIELPDARRAPSSSAPEYEPFIPLELYCLWSVSPPVPRVPPEN